MKKGILCIVTASLLFGAMPSANKYVMLSGVSAEATAFWGQLTICMISYVLIRLFRYSIHMRVRQALYLLAVGASGMGITTLLVNSACLYIPAGLATVLHFLYPSIVSITMVLFFGQKITKYKLAAIACSITGMCFIAGLQSAESGKLTGILFALTSSLTYSFYIIANDKGKINAYPLLVKLFYSSAGSSLLMGLLTIAEGGTTRPTSSKVTIVLFGVCGACCMVAFYLITAGIKRVGAGVAAFFNMTEPIASVVISAVLYRDVITPRTMFGIILVVLSVMFVAIDGRHGAVAQ